MDSLTLDVIGAKIMDSYITIFVQCIADDKTAWKMFHVIIKIDFAW